MNTLTKLILVGVAGFAFYDYRESQKTREKLGTGAALSYGQLIPVVTSKSISAKTLKVNDTISLAASPRMSLGALKLSDGMLDGALVLAKVVESGFSKTLGKHTAVFEFTHIRFASGKQLVFKGAIMSEDDPQHMREAPMLGSFVGMEAGAIGIITGFAVGTIAPHYYGKTAAAPRSYIVGDVPAGTELFIKCQYAGYLPFEITSHQSLKREKLAQK